MGKEHSECANSLKHSFVSDTKVFIRFMCTHKIVSTRTLYPKILLPIH